MSEPKVTTEELLEKAKKQQESMKKNGPARRPE